MKKIKTILLTIFGIFSAGLVIYFSVIGPVIEGIAQYGPGMYISRLIGMIVAIGVAFLFLASK